jgi:hypothetical protein
MNSFNLKYLLKTLSPNVVTLGGRFQHMSKGRVTIQFTAERETDLFREFSQ